MTDTPQEPGTPEPTDAISRPEQNPSAAPEAADNPAPANTAPANAAPANPAPANAAPAAPQADARTAPSTAQAAATGQPVGAPGQPVGAFGQPVGTPNYAPYSAEQSYATQPTQPYPPVPGHPGKARKSSTKKRGGGVLVAMFAIGALIGGGAGAGVVGVYAASQDQAHNTASSTGPANITVNNANNATVVTAVAAKASPSVVTISVTGSSSGGTGSGIILSEDGYVLTNTHVVTLDGQTSTGTVQVQDNSGKLYSATIVGTDPVADLAVIKLKDASGLTPATFADSAKLNVGDVAVAIGAPLGLSGTVTDGIVSALNRSITVASSAVPDQGSQDDGNGNGDQGNGPFDFWNFDLPGQQGQSKTPKASSGTIALPVIQTDAAINPGNSGGALLNSKGQVIGVNVAIANAGSGNSTSQGGSIGVGFAIPANLAQRVAQELIKDHSATHGLLGANVKDATSDSSSTVGALIVLVSNGGAAEKAGLQKGDVVTNFNGLPITGMTDLTAQVRALAAGSTADLTYVRDGKTETATVTLGKLAI